MKKYGLFILFIFGKFPTKKRKQAKLPALILCNLSAAPSGGYGHAARNPSVFHEIKLVVKIHGGAAMAGNEQDPISELECNGRILDLEMLFARRNGGAGEANGNGHPLIHATGFHTRIHHNEPFLHAHHGGKHEERIAEGYVQIPIGGIHKEIAPCLQFRIYPRCRLDA